MAVSGRALGGIAELSIAVSHSLTVPEADDSSRLPRQAQNDQR